MPGFLPSCTLPQDLPILWFPSRSTASGRLHWPLRGHCTTASRRVKCKAPSPDSGRSRTTRAARPLSDRGNVAPVPSTAHSGGTDAASGLHAAVTEIATSANARYAAHPPRHHVASTLQQDAQVMTASSSFARPSGSPEWLPLLVPGLPLHLVLYASLERPSASASISLGPGPPLQPLTTATTPTITFLWHRSRVPRTLHTNTTHSHQHLSFLLWQTALMRRRLWRQPNRRPPRYRTNNHQHPEAVGFRLPTSFPSCHSCWLTLLHLKHAIPRSRCGEAQLCGPGYFDIPGREHRPSSAAGSVGATVCSIH